MLTTMLGEVKGLVDAAFLRTCFFPTLVFVVAGGVVLATGEGGLDPALTGWDSYSVGLQFLLLGAALALVFVLASFASIAVILLIQVFEGYLLPASLRNAGVRRQKARREVSQEKSLRFPGGRDDLMPTALGNVLKAAEEYPRQAYGIDSLVAWPRLSLLLPSSLLQSAAAAFDSMRFLLLICLLSGLFAVLAGIYTAAAGAGAVLYLAVVIGGLVLARASYRAATEAAVEYGLHVRAAFDLHRNDLLDHLRQPLPTTAREERRTWAWVCARLAAGDPQSVRYGPAPEES